MSRLFYLFSILVLLLLSNIAPAFSIVKKGAATGNDPVVTMETSKGVIKLQVFKTETPITAGNFVDLVKNGFYNGLTFHRYEPGFLVQGGDPKGTGFGVYVDNRTREERKIPLEVKPTLRHDLGSLCMSHALNDPNSGSCQFYISLSAQPKLDMQYAVFGRVIDGLPVVSNLRAGDKILKATVQEPGVK